MCRFPSCIDVARRFCGLIICLFASPAASLAQLHSPQPHAAGPPTSSYRQTAATEPVLRPSMPPAPPAQSPYGPPGNYRGTDSSVPQPPVVLPMPGGHTFQEGPGHGGHGEVYQSPYELNFDGAAPPRGPVDLPYSLDSHGSRDEYCLPYQGSEYYQWTLLPSDLLYSSYLGAPREPRLAQSLLYLNGTGWIWELEAGGRAGIMRYGTAREDHNEGWQLDVWGGAFPRLVFGENLDLDAVDFKVGVPLTWRQGQFQAKLEWYHISSHLGDEFLLRNPTYPRLDYLRDSIVLGGGYFPVPELRLYAEADYAYNKNGGAEPWHFQFGVDYSPICTTPISRPDPFFAVSGLIREEVRWSGGVNVVTGVQWRGVEKESLFRIGLQYYNGQSLQLSFLNDWEQLYGIGMWYDF
ncbi:DUF1207 domain-containing protein [Rubinisphaera margarita]|uniref:DUF1207 domain-containing protein n=1 Tax=Rubinisphaera margarita TaxID=2909586 RepID=UPI001EE8A0C9|nr:DUF1207 domain-containing protein [Rubinisphaera margarita]MCG6154907.1 DUF1207 domain-containing protein [Rubinisphaera margarita]